MVLQLVSGLSDAYANVGSQIRHSETLPPFYKSRSMIVLEEMARAKQTAVTAANSTFIAAQENNNSDSSSSHHPNCNNNKNNGGRSGRGGYNRGGRGRGRGGGRGGRSYYHQQGSGQQPQAPQHQWVYPPWNAQWQPWATPPCPYPTTGNWQRPVAPNRQPGILGAKPQQAHVAATQSSYAPTDIQAAMHTLSLAPPDEQWYMDTGATSHMTANRGNLTSYSNISNNIIVGNGHNIPVISCGNALLQNSQYP
jgi:hypothetical protein